MINSINAFIVMKKLYLMALVALACSNDPVKPQPPVVDDDEPKQYGTPFSAVSDPQSVVLYEVNIRAFSDAGNFQGVTDKLDQIKALGFNTIWLMPINPVGKVRSAGGLGSPYSVQNYVEVNPEFGNLDDLRALVQGAHDRNMAVIIDWVANHTSWDNPWMVDKSWYTQDASGNVIIPPGTNWQDVAELNYDNQKMRAAMIHAMKYWVLEANVDGFRCDAVDFVPADFWKQAIDELKSIPARKLILLAEGGKQENFTAGFQMNYAWDFYTNMKAVYNGKSASSIFTTHEAEYKSIPPGAIKLRYTTNHDLSAWEETPIEAFGSSEAALSASVITVFTSAAPLIYSSQEVGREEKLPFFTREPIDWSAHQEMMAQYAKIFSIYNQSDVFMKGELQYYSNDDIAVFTRTKDSEQYLVIVNVRADQKTWQAGSFKQTEWINAADDSSYTISETISLNPYQYLVLRKK
jgi:1,4-alpha-glucan branching enzyme